ncbi:hypothetical protein [Seonamhaeicola aphaedonensis]|uniref:Uncharacterized protein n=1 Tax=Seonamhaeicola aphaedonensis TaxID=1461338 RepID=A0A3D9H821_9FLAO|nr:hypothetical protein [Seonamhaeicola aphaedonensis]RED45640.1 hypothetical protein DFQ02_10818 [Seonamhaeicola aphaedonensis]
MIHRIKTSKFTKVIASYMAIQLILTTVQPSNLFALGGGPAQPEFNAFTPIGTSDMVDLASGDFNYNIPIMDIGGYPINLAYNSGVTMDQEASWVGLGWNLNVGQINRQIRGIPDDFDGTKLDTIRYENNIKNNITVGASLKLHPAVAGKDLGLSLAGASLGVEYNNYQGLTFKPSVGLSYQMSDKVSVGMNLSTSTTQGATVQPSLSIGETLKDSEGNRLGFTPNSSYGLSLNSRQGITNLTINRSNSGIAINKNRESALGGSGSISGSSNSTLLFADNTFTPTKRPPYLNTTIGFNAALGTEITFGEFQGEIYGYASVQKMKDKVTTEKVFGYEHTEKASKHDVLDFNRENDRSLSQNTTTLPIPNYTYDVYSINGQGIGGSFRPFRSQVGYVFDKYVKDFSSDTSLGIEFGTGNLVKLGADFKFSPSISSTGLWENGNRARRNYTEQLNGNAVDYENVYFKNIGETNVDREFQNVFINKMGGYQPVRIGIGGFMLDKKTIPNKYFMGVDNPANIDPLTPTSTFSKIKRDQRLVRKQSILKLTKDELLNITNNYTTENKPKINTLAKSHHTTAISIFNEDGSTYQYFQPLYNTKKIEATFAVDAKNYDCESGLVSYSGKESSTKNESGRDHFFNRVSTPAYAHTYLLSSVLSSDYEDLTGNGPTDDDLGSYTKFIYKKTNSNYKWRVPVELNTATLNEGLNSLSKDQTGSYTYGEKELMYIDKIETKTHVAIFNTNVNRNDALGVSGENGGANLGNRMRRLSRIELYSKPEYKERQSYLEDNDNSNNHLASLIKPIKTAHFVYDYSLCKGVPNSVNSNTGKLTLKQVYFTYRGSNMGKYTPYEFTYEKEFNINGQIVNNNPNYDIKGYNLWGNHKDNDGNCGIFGETTNSEFPYVEQDKAMEDINAAAWSLVKIGLPSGGTIDVDYESDDYQYVQNKKALQMFKLVGATDGIDFQNANDKTLYSSTKEISHIYIEVDELISAQDFIDRYVGDLQNEVIYFRFLMNMIKNTSSKYDYVTGYFKLDSGYSIQQNTTEGTTLVAIPVKKVSIGDSGLEVNPFSKAAWQFARTYLNRLAYSQNGSEDNFSVAGIMDDIVSQLKNITEIFQGPNRYLRNQKCANSFVPNKSWIRLQNPNGKKLGGGVRVTKIEMNDEWDVMTDNDDNPVYRMNYGQEYNYETLDGKSSGVAAYEPQGGKENPFVVPFEDYDLNRLLAPSDKNYVEGPLGSSFFPAPRVTYSRVTAKNLDRTQEDNGVVTAQVGKHATGMVVNEFYTSKDFPTIAKHTMIDDHYNEIGTGITGGIASFFNLNVYQDRHLALSQGFTVITNDMDGKPKSQRVYPERSEGNQDAISAVEYIYHTKTNGELENELQVYDKNGTTSKETIGVHYDVVNDFRTSRSLVTSFGADGNLAIAIFGLFPVFAPSINNINFAFHRNTMRSAATTKVVHKTGLLKEKIAYDLGSSVSTKNLVYDALTGEVLLTETTNEFKEHYYNFNYPAYWAYNGMGQASNNLGMKTDITYDPTYHYRFATDNANTYLIDGDEVWSTPTDTKYWVVNVGKYGYNSFDLMDSNGVIISSPEESIKVLRSGYRNFHTASMASVTTMKNPLTDGLGIYQNIDNNTLNSNDWNTYRVVNTNAVKYSDAWPSQCECSLPKISIDANENVVVHNGQDFNPYRYNVKGDWRAKSSYAYLTSRENGSLDPNPRNTGFLSSHTPFHRYNGNWYTETNDPAWTYASEVTEYSPYGAELENQDALDRYSAAQYGFNYTFPLAVTSNSRYQEMGYDSFEDVDTQCEDGHFNFKKRIANYGGVEVSKDESHSGRQSIKIKPNNIAAIESRIVPCDTLSGN